MKNELYCILFAALCLSLFSCSDMVSPDTEHDFEFENDFYIVNADTVTIYRTTDLISVGLEPGVDLDAFNQLIAPLDLQLLQRFSHSPIQVLTEHHIQNNEHIILKLPSGVDKSQFFSYSQTLDDNSFAKNESIKYSLPVFSSDPDNDAWFYPSNGISIKALSDSFSEVDFSEQFNLEFVSKIESISHYHFRDNHFEHGDPMELARKIYDTGLVEYAVPDGYREISRH